MSDNGSSTTTDTSSDDDAPRFVVLVPDSQSDTESYQRLGSADTETEEALADGSTAPANGVFLWSKDDYVATVGSYTLNTNDSMETKLGESMTVVSDGNVVVKANWVSPSPMPLNATFQITDSITSTVGNLSNFTIGNSLTNVVGWTASTSTGFNLRANVGWTENIFTGSVINVTNGMMDVRGTGQTNVVPTQSVTAIDSLTFTVSPDMADVATQAGVLVTQLGKITTTISALTATANLINTTVVGTKANKYETDKDRMTSTMEWSFGVMNTISALMIAMEVMAQIAASYAKTAAAAQGNIVTAAAGIEISEAGVEISAGTTKVTISETGVNAIGGTFDLFTDSNLYTPMP